MRRTMGNMGRRGNNNGPGPLMTGHLKDIDLELELLKRKREMIEQQQQLLVMEQQFKSSRHSYDQMRYDEPKQQGSNRDYTNMYDNGPKQRNQFGRKRQSEVSWQYDGPSKAPPKKKSYQFSQHAPGSSGSSRYNPRGPAPLMDVKIKPSIGQRIANRKPSPNAPHKDFTLTKQFKPKAANKLASKNLAERKSLVAANGSVTGEDVSRMLLPDRVPTQQVSGRLELALGAIMKNIRDLIDKDPSHAPMLRSSQIQRVMKQAVRERIRTVMLGKVVGSLLDILAIYREEFPEETDIDIVNIALEAGGHSAKEREEKCNFIKSEDPTEFFKVNMNCLLESRLNEMFAKLEEIYGNSPPETNETSEDVIDLNKIAEEKKEQDQNNQEYKDFLNSNFKVYEIKRILPRLMKRYVPYITKLLNVDGMYQTTKAAITMKATQKATSVFHNKAPEEGQGDAENTAAATTGDDGQTNTENRHQHIPYFVKIMGRPTLPKRKVMQGFLSQFNPKSIKKHRTIHNLLFVGFLEKSDFDVMVGADGTVIGRSTLSVRICSKDPKETPQNESNNDSNGAMETSQDDAKKEQVKDDEVITAELDGQISDLLSSIRKSEEDETKAKEKNSGEAVAEQADENKTEQDKETNENDDAAKPEDTDEMINNTGEIANAAEDTPADEITASTEYALLKSVETENSELVNEPENSEVTDEPMAENAQGLNMEHNSEATNITEEENSDATNIIEKENSESSNITEKENSEASNITETENSESSNIPEKENGKEEDSSQNIEQSENDKVSELKESATGRSTPSRMSARLANVTPSSIRTRRASRMAPN